MLKGLRDFFNKSNFILNMRKFIASDFYLMLVTVLAIISYHFAIELYVVFPYIIFFSFSLVISDDFKPYMLPLLMFIFMIPTTHFRPGQGDFTNSYYYQNVWCLVIYGILIIIALTLKFLIWGGFKEIFTKKTVLSIPIIAFSLALITNGLFNENYTLLNLLYAVTFIFCGIFISLIFLHNLKYDSNLTTYFCKCCFYASIFLLTQILSLYLNPNVIWHDAIQKGQINFGWGISNNFGGMMTIFIAPIFYLASKEKIGIIYYLVGILTFVSIFFTLSKASILIAVPVFIISLVYLMTKSKYRVLYLIVNVCLLLVVFLFGILYKDKLNGLFKNLIEASWFDVDRLNLWEKAFNNFLAHPIFGGGFYSCEYKSRAFLPGFYHNTLFEILGCVGAFGIITYAYYRYKTFYMVLKKINRERFFLGLMLLALLLVSLLDNHMFNVYPLFYYSIMIAIIELDYKNTLGLLKK